MALSDRVKELRERNGFSQSRLAETAGVSQGMVSRIESGEVRSLQSGTLGRLADALGVTADYLLEKVQMMSADDSVNSEPVARHIFRGFHRLSGQQKQMMKSFFDALLQMEPAEEEMGTGRLRRTPEGCQDEHMAEDR